MCTDQATRGIGRAFSVTQYIDHAALSRLDLLFKTASEMEILALYPISLTVTDSFNPQAFKTRSEKKSDKGICIRKGGKK